MSGTEFVNGSARLVLAYIDQYIQDVGWAPNYKEIQEHTGLASSSVVSYALKRLSERGLIKHQPREARAICVTEAGRAYLAARRG